MGTTTEEPAARLPNAAARLPAATRIADYSVMVLAVLLGGGSLVLFAWAGGPMLVAMHFSPTAALWWNAVLSLVFFAQHSVMVRRPVRARLAALIPARYDGAFYAITSGIALTLVAVLYQRVGAPLFVLHGVWRLTVDTVALLAAASFAWGIIALRTFDPFGLRPIRQHLRSGPGASSEETSSCGTGLVVRGPYRWVRHPLYSAVIVLLWATPQMSPSRLELAALWTVYVCVGALLEERDLTAEFGEAYRQYCERVPMLIPWRGPAPTQPA